VNSQRAELEIDPDELDVELLRQPMLHFKYSKRLGDAEGKLLCVEEELKRCRSRLILKARTYPEQCFGPDVNPTDVMCEAFYRGDGQHRRLKEEWLALKKAVGEAWAAVNAVQTRRAALSGLTSLAAQGYFSMPAEPKEDATGRRKARESCCTERRRRTK